MKLALLADIHEAVEHLEWAIRLLRDVCVERFVVLGDLAVMGERLDETVRLMRSACGETTSSRCASRRNRQIAHGLTISPCLARADGSRVWSTAGEELTASPMMMGPTVFF